MRYAIGYRSTGGLATRRATCVCTLMLAAALAPVTAHAQGPPDIVWMAGGHSGYVYSVAFSPPDGEILASGSKDGTVKLWRVSDGSLIRTLCGRGSDVYSVAFSPDGQLLASGNSKSIINLWRVSDGSLIRTLTGNAQYVHSVAFSPNGELLASASEDRDPNLEGVIQLWRVSDGSLVRTLTCLLYTSPSPRDRTRSRMPSSA